MRYYSTKRPVTPGSYPKQKFAVKIHNFEQKNILQRNRLRGLGIY